MTLMSVFPLKQCILHFHVKVCAETFYFDMHVLSINSYVLHATECDVVMRLDSDFEFNVSRFLSVFLSSRASL